MAYHKLTVIGRLVSDPKFRTFANGGGVAKFGIPIDFTRRKKNPTTGEWEGESFIIDVDAFNREPGFKMADLVMQSLKKGSQVYIEGRLKPNEYTDKNGTKVFKPVLVVDTLQLLDRPDGGGMSEGGMSEGGMTARATTAAAAPRKQTPAPFTGNGGGGYDASEDDASARGGSGGQDDEIPF